MLRNFHKEMEATRREVRTAIKETIPAKEFGATMTLVLIHLGLTEKEIRTTTNLKERRMKIHEFDRIKTAIGKGTRLLRNSNPGRRFSPEDQKQCVP
jgi:hypothetical protein